MPQPKEALRRSHTEYQTQKCTGLLLGSRLGKCGILALAREKHDPVTLNCDEIEKAHPRVVHIFLQILDAACNGAEPSVLCGTGVRHLNLTVRDGAA